MSVNEALFLQRYNNLNPKQRLAVDTIYGPVMVIAGPGTGKTEVLSMRIANLLRSEAQVQPYEILCLTYTDEATNSMRRRLVQIIGAAAHKVNISTFHGFCNNVIQDNSDLFSMRSLQPVTELEKTELLYEILDELPSKHPLRKLSGKIYYSANKLSSLFDMMKRENLMADKIELAIAEYLDDLPNREEYVYKKSGKNYKKGDLKQDAIDEEKAKMETTLAAAKLFDAYEQKMKERGRYDFNDMIIWVLEAFKKYPGLLLSYQERHQFILVDEFQDTNGSQSELLNMLTQYWGEESNIFVVGDDDQSIYEFQGARIRNIMDFHERYKDTVQVIVLTENYRSSQHILDKATATITNNKQRLIYNLRHLDLDKNITASAERFKEARENVHPVVKVYNNILQEEADIIMQIEKLHNDGIKLNEIAILYAQHKQAENLTALMERKGIPYTVKRPVNILDQPLIQQLINVFRYIDAEKKQSFSGEAYLFEILHSPYYGLAATDIARLALYMQLNKAKDKSLGIWRMTLSNGLLLESLGIKTAPAFIRLGNNIESWIMNQAAFPLPLLLEKMVYESGIMPYLLGTKDSIWNVQVISTFFEFVKEIYSRNARITVAELLNMLDKMIEEGISISLQKVIQNDNGVHFYTAHGAKGNEFEYVFLIGCTSNFWEKKRGAGNEYKMPDTITRDDDNKDSDNKTEVARRLFYVALTRAKKYLQVSYANADNEGKTLAVSSFIDEISTAEERITVSLGAADIINHMEWAMSPVPAVRIEIADRQYIERILLQFTMSYTALSKYLRCPVAFYYEQILHVPVLKNDALAFGSAVHTALERMFKWMKEHENTFPPKDQVIGSFVNALKTEAASFAPAQWDRRMEQGQTILSEYYDRYIHEFHKIVEVEYKIPRYMLDGVPVTAKIDKIELDGDSCTIIDYKTGDPDKAVNALTVAPNEKEPNGGDYWRQMVFYKIVIDNYQEKPWNVRMGMFDYIEKSKKDNEFKKIVIPIFDNDETTVRQQLRSAYGRIMNHEFDEGCGKPDCYWCNFAKKYDLVRPEANEEVEIDDV